MEISAKLNNISLKGIKLNEGICLNRKSTQVDTKEEIQKQPKYDILELKETGENQKPLCTQEIKIEGPPEFRRLTLHDVINAVQNAVETANRKNMTYDERMKFLDDSFKNWVTDKKENDEEMFAFFLKVVAKSNIEAGRPEVEGLPSDFTMEDYHYYVDKWEGIWEQQRNEWNAFFKRNHTT